MPIERMQFELGDTEMPKAPVHGGSITLASVGNAVVAACQALRRKLAEQAGTEGDIVAMMQQAGLDKMEADGSAKPGDETNTYSSSAFGAVFVEVKVDPATEPFASRESSGPMTSARSSTRRSRAASALAALWAVSAWRSWSRWSGIVTSAE